MAAILFALPPLYLATDRSADPAWWRYSIPHALALAGSTVWWILIWRSYARRLTRAAVRARTAVVAGAFALVVTLLGTEGILRLLDPAPYAAADNGGRHLYDPDVGHVYRPNHRQILQTREWRQEWRSNAEGVRADRDYGPKPPGVFRILVVGDSYTVGDQVPLDSTYPGVLQRRLDEQYGPGRFEVVNAGFPGYGTVHAARWIRKFGPRFQPDLVLLGMTPNDLRENPDPLRVIARDGYLVRARATSAEIARWRERRRWYSLAGWVERSLLRRRLGELRFGSDAAASRTYVHRHAFLRELDAEGRELWELARLHLREARDAAAGMGARFAAVAIPFRLQLEELGDGLDGAAFGRRWARIAEEEGVPFFDLLPLFRSHPDPRRLYWEEDSHCTAAGYELIGAGVFSFLESGALGVDLRPPPAPRAGHSDSGR